jgi:hypothetical protein
MDVGEDSYDSDGRVLLLIHDMVGQSDEELGEDFQDLSGLEVSGGVGHDHGHRFLEEVEEPVFVVGAAEVDRHPVRELFIVGGPVHGFLDEGLDRDVIKVDLSFLYKPGSGNFGNFDAQAELVLEVAKLGVEASKFFLDDVVFILDNFKLLQGLFLFVEGGPKRQFSSMFANGALEGISFLDCLFDVHEVGFLVAGQEFLEEETLELS